MTGLDDVEGLLREPAFLFFLLVVVAVVAATACFAIEAELTADVRVQPALDEETGRERSKLRHRSVELRCCGYLLWSRVVAEHEPQLLGFELEREEGGQRAPSSRRTRKNWLPRFGQLREQEVSWYTLE